MKRHAEERHERLRRALRAGDPAGDGADPTPAEIAGWRSRMMGAAGAAGATAGGRAGAPAIRWAVSAAALVAAGILIGFLARDLVSPRPARPPAAADAAGAAGAPPGLRTIRMSAPGGTRIIWTMNPRLDLGEGGGDRGQDPRRPRRSEPIDKGGRS